MMKPYFKLYHSVNKTINESSQSNEVNESHEVEKTYNKNTEQDYQIFAKYHEQQIEQIMPTFSSNKVNKDNLKSDDPSKKYSTIQQSETKYFHKNIDYNSGKFNSTQAASSYNRFTTETHFKEDLKSDFSSNTVKKQLFLQEKTEQSSPKFKLSESKFDTLAFTFKKKVNQYPRIFGEKTSQQKLKTFIPTNQSGKINFQKINFSNISKSADILKENNSAQLNAFEVPQINVTSIKKKINFQTVNLSEQNPLIKRINEEIKKDQQEIFQLDKDYKISRKNQRDLIKKKILESRSDLKRFYEDNSQNVQYEYRKAKFMDIFLGSKTLEHNIR